MKTSGIFCGLASLALLMASGAAAGQAGAAGGYLGFTESIRQLTGAPIGKQVKDAELALVSGFGMINYDRGLSSGAALLARAP